jgi:tetratricopeptide (TPR) repeat protein
VGGAAADAELARFLAALRAGRDREAELALASLRSRDPDSPRTAYAMGLLALSRGDDAGALEKLRLAAAGLPHDLAVQSNHALCLQRLDRHEEALAQFDRVLASAPRFADAHYNRGISLASLGRDAAALASWCSATDLDPQHAQAWTRLADLLHRLRRWQEAVAACERAIALRPRHAALHAQRALLKLELGDTQAALADARAASAIDPMLYEAAFATASAMHRLGQHDACCEWATRALELRPQAPEALKLRGLAHQAAHRLAPAAEDVLAAARLRFAPGPRTHPLPADLRQTSRSKLAHDLEQLRYLRERIGLHDADALVEGHARVLSGLQPGAGDASVFELDADQLRSLHHGYNRLHHVTDAPRMAHGALHPRLDGAAIARDYHSRAPGITWIDDFLRPEALTALRRYCLESTLWFDFRHANGYLGAFFEDGFAAPLLLQIAEELRAAAPSVFLDHPLLQLWAFKYDSRLEGIELHADVAAINVNFWITPDDANLDPERGGLLIWDRKAPPGWGLDEFNTSSAAGQARIREHLDARNAECVRVPYRCNRAVVFHSDLFHRTDQVRFAPGYENRRINVTMLFGHREGRRG